MKTTTYALLALLTALPSVSSASIASKLNDLEDCRVAITNAIVTKGGAASGALTNAAAEIAALPSGGNTYNDGDITEPKWKDDGYDYAWIDFDRVPGDNTVYLALNFTANALTIDWGDGTTWTTNVSVSYNNNVNVTHTYDTTEQRVYAIRFDSPNNFVGYGYTTSFIKNDSRIFFAFEKGKYTKTGGFVMPSTPFIYFIGNGVVDMYPPSVSASISGIISTGGLKSFINPHNITITTSKQGFNQGSFSRYTATNLGNFDLDLGTSARALFQECGTLSAVPQTIDTSNCTDTQSMFLRCYSLTEVPDTLDLSQSLNCYAMFFHCANLIRVPAVLDVSKSTTCWGMFGGCLSLRNLPDTLNLLSCNSVDAIFQNCVSITNVPTHLSTNLSVSFAQSTLVSKDSVATFDGDGNITGGMVFNLNTCSNSGQVITLSSATRSLFTADEQSAISAALTEKNWTLAW